MWCVMLREGAPLKPHGFSGLLKGGRTPLSGLLGVKEGYFQKSSGAPVGVALLFLGLLDEREYVAYYAALTL